MPNRLKLLVAEDSHLDVFLLERALQQTGVPINAQFVRDGQEAMDYLEGAGQYADRTKYPLPSLILLDLKMPRLSGFDVLTWVKSRPEYRMKPVIIFSSSDDHGDVDRAYTLGANTYLIKPRVAEDLPHLVQLLDKYWRQNALLPSGSN